MPGLLAKNEKIREEMFLKKQNTSFTHIFMKSPEEEYEVRFNPNNKLEEVADAQYVNLMSTAAYVNTDRHLKEKYITPELLDFYGSNPKISGNIGYYDIYQAHGGDYNPKYGRLPDNFAGVEVHFIENFDNFEDLGKKSPTSAKYLEQMYKDAAKLVFTEGTGTGSTGSTTAVIYTPFTKIKSGNSTIISSNSEFDDVDFFDDKLDYGNDELSAPSVPTDVKYNNDNDLFTKTKELFRTGHINTMINRTQVTVGNKTYHKGRKFGNSDYGRAWTKNNQYLRVNNLAGNFKEKNENNEDGVIPIRDVQSKLNGSFRPILYESDNKAYNGADYLSQNTVLNNTGFVNITPSNDVVNGEGQYNIKRCMFSIENLAWKDVADDEQQRNISKEQRGPNGGRIMWFPPYDLDFSENVSVNWDSNSFIGRGEEIFTYTNTRRNGRLSFSLLIDHPNVINVEGIRGQADDEDFLKFFAGEGMLDISKNKNEEAEKDNTVPSSLDEAKQEQPEVDDYITFTIYFPYNYSGLYEIKEEKTYNQATDISEVSDSLWYLYLFLGRDNNLEDWNPAGVIDEHWRGYEMQPNMGLTSGETGEDPLNYYPQDVVLNSSGECAYNLWQIGIPTEDGDNKYYYRSDFDMRSVLGERYYYDDLSENSLDSSQFYKDESSEQLNSFIEDDDIRNYSFAVVLTSILSANKDINTNPYISYLTKELGIIDAEDKINELIEKCFSESARKNITSIEIKPFSNRFEGIQDVRQSCVWGQKELRKRRGKTVKYFLQQELGISPDKVKVDDSGKVTETSNDISEIKRSMKVEVKINFKTRSIVSLADTADNMTLNESSGVTFSENNSNIEVPTSKTADSQSEEKKEESVVVVRRYETEAEYFNKLKTSDPVYFKELKDKFKYFTPAFHSISPEGFNARLNFLQQCTRQGHTYEINDPRYGKTAGNLAFGRMPVCVIRIGDFIYTRAIIESMSISYSDGGSMRWDLNPEGAGVQPMYAKVDLNIILLGGQSLSGPISRLQNAITFDYYANTGVYDDRADMVQYEGKNVVYKKIWKPSEENSTSSRETTATGTGVN